MKIYKFTYFLRFMKILTKRKLYLILVAFFILHFVLQFGSLLLAAALGMDGFDNPDNMELVIRSDRYFMVYTVLSFPLLFTVDRIVPVNFFLYGLLWYLLFILNSVLWTFVFYLILKKFYKFQDK